MVETTVERPIKGIYALIQAKMTERLEKAIKRDRILGDQQRASKLMGDFEHVEAIWVELKGTWEPFREYIGACPKCKGTRVPSQIPSATERTIGFGCPDCGDFEVMKG
jgi:hypothetical protein